MVKIKLFLQKWQAVLLIIVLSIAAYGLLIPWLGLYMDDWTFNWVYQTFGAAGLTSYFSTNRPVWGLLYQATMPILQDNILAWHLFGLFWKIMTSISFYWLMTLLWPKRKNLTLTAGLLFAVYPGFLLQPLALTFGHIWIIYSVFLVSNCFTVLAIRNPEKRIGFTIAALFLSLVNIACMEYFLPLEVIRLVFLFYLLGNPQPFFKRVWSAFKLWLPYLAVLLAVTIYRAFFFKDQTHIYSLYLLDTFKQSIGAGLVQLLRELGSGLYQSAVYAWIQPFLTFLARFSFNRTILGIVGLAAVIFFGLLLLMIRKRQDETKNDLSAPIIAVLALLLAGVPFYVTALPVQAAAINSRFTMPFMVGAALLLAYLIDLIPVRWLKAGLLSLLIAASVGFNVLNENDFRLMSQKNNELMYEIAWRAPDLSPNTLIVTTEESESSYFTYSTLKAELNLIYPHDKSKSFGWVFSRDLAAMYAPPIAEGAALKVPAIVQDYSGTSSNVVTFQLSDYGCARFVEGNSGFINKDISDYSLQNISHAGNLIGGGSSPVQLNPALIGPEPAHGWCYYFEKSDLALQMKDYAAIQQYYQKVSQKSLHPYYGYEWFPFIEGLAGAGDWQEALNLSQKVIAENPTNESYQPYLCQVLPGYGTSENSSAATSALDGLGCK